MSSCILLNKSVPNYELTQLLTYREILVNKQEDEDYVEDFSIDDIVGKIVKLTAGCELRCPKVPSECISTTTSTTLATTTSTTTIVISTPTLY